MTTEVRHPPTDREVLQLLVEREWLQKMQARLENVVQRLEGKIGNLEEARNA